MINGRVAVCVYCGSRPGGNAQFAAAAAALGQALAARHWAMVYGGGKVGLMGVVADAALAAGAPVVGVIPRRLVEREVAHTGLNELIVVDDMHQRKHAMAQRADAFLALPGGLGTLEELFEMWTWRQLGYHDKPLALVNSAGFYAPLLDFIVSAQRQGFIDPKTVAHLIVAPDVDCALERLADELGTVR